MSHGLSLKCESWLLSHQCPDMSPCPESSRLSSSKWVTEFESESRVEFQFDTALAMHCPIFCQFSWITFLGIRPLCAFGDFKQNVPVYHFISRKSFGQTRYMNMFASARLKVHKSCSSMIESGFSAKANCKDQSVCNDFVILHAVTRKREK